MAKGAQRLGDAGCMARLETDIDRGAEQLARLDEPARRGDGGRDIESAIDDGAHELGVDLRLGVTAHRADDDPRVGLAVTEQHPGEQRVERPFPRLEHVRMIRLEAEVGAAVVVVDACLRVDDARAEPGPVRLDEAHRVALAIDGRHVDGVADARVHGHGRLGGARRIDAGGDVGEAGRVEEVGDRNVTSLGSVR